MDEPVQLQWYVKHPCTRCQCGWGECMRVQLETGTVCCQGCKHPTRWEGNQPYTAEDYVSMGVRISA